VSDLYERLEAAEDALSDLAADYLASGNAVLAPGRTVALTHLAIATQRRASVLSPDRPSRVLPLLRS
jgi:hypothetical protein